MPPRARRSSDAGSGGLDLEVWFNIDAADRYKRLARALKEAGRGDLQRKLTRAIRRQGAPALKATQAAWHTIDVQSQGDSRSGGSGLRARVASATRLSILGSGIRIRVEARRVDGRYGRQLTYGLNGLGRWRYPLFGDREHWHQNWGREVFHKTLQGFAKEWRNSVEQAMETTAREISG